MRVVRLEVIALTRSFGGDGSGPSRADRAMLGVRHTLRWGGRGGHGCGQEFVLPEKRDVDVVSCADQWKEMGLFRRGVNGL